MKKTITALAVLLCLEAYAQSDTPMPDSATVVSFPWYDNNQFLEDYLEDRGYYGNPIARTNCPVARYHIPVRIHIYRNNVGGGNFITQANALEVFERTNDLFENSSTMIQFYLDDLEFVNNENFRTGIDSFFDAANMFLTEGENGVVNIHMIASGDHSGTGYAITPFIPSTQISNIGALKWNCYVETFDRENDEIANTLGHVLGLLHTHHPGRLISLAFNEENGTISNGCYQESSDPNQKNSIFGCFATAGKYKGEINGDFLRDTNGDPGQSFEEDNNGVILKRVVPAPSCQYENPGFGNDYSEDNDGGDWNPPVHNIMSYSNFTCQDEFTPYQIASMWYYIEEDFMDHFVPSFTAPSSICTTGGTVTLNNPPPGANISWTASPSSLVHSSTLSGNGTSAFIKARDTNVRGWVTITFHQGNSCEFFHTKKRLWIGKPDYASQYKLYTWGFFGDQSVTLSPQGLFYFQMETVPGATSYNWMLPSGFIFHNTNNTSFAQIWTPATPGNYQLKVQPENSCGNSGMQTLNIHIPGGGGPDPNCPNPPCKVPHPARVGEIDTLFNSIQVVSINPNPVETELNIQSNLRNTNYNLRIHSTAGKAIYTYQGNDELHQLNMTSMKSGIYFVNISWQDADGQLQEYRKKVIKK